MIRHYTEASAATSATQEHNSSGPCVFVPALGLLSVIEQSKEGEHRFVLQSVSFVRVDMEEGVKQLDKMALMCLKNLMSLIKAHTHAPQRQTEQTQFSAASAEWLFLFWLQRFSSLCSKSGSGWLCGALFSTVILIDSLPHLLGKWQQGFGFKTRRQSVTLCLCCRDCSPLFDRLIHSEVVIIQPIPHVQHFLKSSGLKSFYYIIFI